MSMLMVKMSRLKGRRGLTQAFVLSAAMMLSQDALAQASREHDHWLFGNKCRLDFDANGAVTPALNPNTNAQEGVAAVSDPVTGELLLYTDGNTAWDGSDQRVSTGPLGGLSSTADSLIVPVPGSYREYYVLATPATENNGYNPGAIKYTRFDARRSQEVVQVGAPTEINGTATSWESMTAIRHANGVDYWIIASSSTALLVIPITASGVGDAVSYDQGAQFARYWGQFSTTAAKDALYYAGSFGTISRWDFDASTGVPSNRSQVANPFGNTSIYGAHISPNGELLYLNRYSPDLIYQVKLSDGSVTSFGAQPGARGGRLRLGPDGLMYVGASGNGPSLQYFRAPDLEGVQADFNTLAMPAGCGVNYGLPERTVHGLTDTDGDGLLDIFEGGLDTDGDGIIDALDPDDDGDGVLTKDELADPNMDGDPADAQDDDLDQVPNYKDPSSAPLLNLAGELMTGQTISKETTRLRFGTPTISNAGQTEEVHGVGQGEQLLFERAGYIRGQAIDVRVTVVKDTSSTLKPEYTVNAAGEFLSTMRSNGEATLRFELFEAQTQTPIEGMLRFQLNDLDSAQILEYVIVKPSELTSYTLNSPTTVRVDDAQVRFDGGVNGPATNADISLELEFAARASFELVLGHGFNGRAEGGRTYIFDADFDTILTQPVTFLPASTHRATYTEGDAPVKVAAALAQAQDEDDDITRLELTLEGGFVDGGAEQLLFAGVRLSSGSAAMGVVQVGGSAVRYSYDGAASVTFTSAQGVALPKLDVNELLQQLMYEHQSAAPTPGERVILAQLTDATARTSNVSTSRVEVIEVNTAPVANPDDFAVADGALGAQAGDVLANDLDDAGAIKRDEVSLSLVDTAGLMGVTLAADGQLTVPAGTPAGIYVLTYEVCEVAAPQLCDRAQVTLNVGLGALSAPTISAPTQGSVLGTSTPTITGSCISGAQVEVAAGMTSLCTSHCVGGVYSCTSIALPDGMHELVATQSDVLTTSAPSAPTQVILDTLAPMVSLSQPLDGLKTNDDTPTISGMSEPGASLVVEVRGPSGALVQTLTPMVDAQGQWSIDATMLPQGSYQVTATATDAAGNSSQAGPSTFEIDTTAPPLDIERPSSGELISTREVTITGKAQPLAEVIVELKDAQGMVVGTQTVTADASGDFSASFAMLANGDYEGVAQSEDEAGNVAQDTTTFKVDSDEPNLQLLAPADESLTNDDTPTIQGTSDADATLTVTIRDEQGALVQTQQVSPDAQGQWSLDATMLPDGTYEVEVIAARPNGKSTTASVEVTIDTVAPALTLDSPGMGAITSMSTLTAVGTTEPEREVKVVVKDSQGQEVFSGVVTSTQDGQWMLELDELADGDYTMEASSEDEAGNQAQAGPVQVTIDTMAPAVTLSSPTPGGTSEEQTPTLTGSAEPNATVEVFIDGVKVGESVADGQGQWSFEVEEALDLGAHRVEVTSTDEAGNKGTTGEVELTIVAPSQPVVITSPADGDQVQGPEVTIKGTGEPGEEITVTLGDQRQDVTVKEDGSWEVSFEDAPAGETKITAKAKDQPGVTLTVEVINASRAYLVTGGCAQSPASPQGQAPWLLFGLLGVGGLWRRKRARRA